jgi:hypothetical protein
MITAIRGDVKSPETCNSGFSEQTASNEKNYSLSLQCLPKRRIIINIRRGSSQKKGEVTNSLQINTSALLFSVFRKVGQDSAFVVHDRENVN